MCDVVTVFILTLRIPAAYIGFAVITDVVYMLIMAVYQHISIKTYIFLIQIFGTKRLNIKHNFQSRLFVIVPLQVLLVNA